jgi:isopenicillin N synthase-like dioxygenase
MGHRTERLTAFQEIPVVDLAPLLTGAPGGVKAVADEIDRHATEVGFFYVTHHGVAQALIDDVVAAARRFFALTDGQKLEISVSRRHRGFVKMGQAVLSKGARADFKESFVWGLELPEDDPDVRAGKALMGPNLWPAEVPELRPAIERYFRAIQDCGLTLLRAFAVALDLPEHYFTERYRKPLARGAVLHYPSQSPTMPDDQFGTSAHTDYGCVTLLWQDSVGGLEVRNKAGQWIPAPPVPGTFVINLGDFMARWTNDRYASTPHRVVNRSGRERFSLPVFFDPDYDTLVECLPSCHGPGNPPRYPVTTCGAYIQSRFDDVFVYRKLED